MPEKRKITKIVYSFQDASVPPQYHRSYKISATRDHFHIRVDSYGDILADKRLDMPEHLMDTLTDYIDLYQIKEKEYKDPQSAYAGSTSKTLVVYSGENVYLNGTVYQNGNRQEGSLSGDIDSFCKKMESFIPDFAALLV